MIFVFGLIYSWILHKLDLKKGKMDSSVMKHMQKNILNKYQNKSVDNIYVRWMFGSIFILPQIFVVQNEQSINWIISISHVEVFFWIMIPPYLNNLFFNLRPTEEDYYNLTIFLYILHHSALFLFSEQVSRDLRMFLLFFYEFCIFYNKRYNKLPQLVKILKSVELRVGQNRLSNFTIKDLGFVKGLRHFLIMRESELCVFQTAPFQLVSHFKIQRKSDLKLKKIKYFQQVCFDPQKMILTVGLSTNEFQFFSVPKLKLLKFSQPKSVIKNYKFHEQFPILADIFENQRRKEIRIYDPFVNEFYKFVQIPSQFCGIKPDLHHQIPPHFFIKEFKVLLFYTVIKDQPYSETEINKQIVIFTNRNKLSSHIFVALIHGLKKKNSFKRLYYKEFLQDLEWLPQQNLLAFKFPEHILLLEPEKHTSIRKIPVLNPPPYDFEQKFILPFGYKTVLIQNSNNYLLLKNTQSQEVEIVLGVLEMDLVYATILLPEKNQILVFHIKTSSIFPKMCVTFFDMPVDANFTIF